MIYANDRSPVNSGPYAKFGHLGTSFSPDPTIPKNEPGHPIDHKFALGIPSSQCIVCHIHPGTNVLNEYLGFMWWDNETDGKLMYPAEQQKYRPKKKSSKPKWRTRRKLRSAACGPIQNSWNNLTDLNSSTRHTQFADFHGHGWVFRAVFKKDRSGNMLDYLGRPIPDPNNTLLQAAMSPPTPEEKINGKERDGVPVHLMDIHLEKGMHCIDCHFNQDNHGNTKLYGEVRAAIEIQCTDCHGTATERPKLDHDRARRADQRFQFASSIARRGVSRGLKSVATTRSFNIRWSTKTSNGKSFKPSTPSRPAIRTTTSARKWPRPCGWSTEPNGESKLEWGTLQPGQQCAHENENMSCIACHSAWNPSCFGCHLPQQANKKMPQLHNDGDVTRNYTSYNFQTLRDDVFMLARDGRVTGNRIGPARSSCAVHVSSYNEQSRSKFTCSSKRFPATV